MAADSVVDSLLPAARQSRVAFRRAVAEAGGAPVADGDETTFLYLGEADAVQLVHWMDVFPPVPAFERQPDSDLWTLTLALPHEARIEYRLRVTRGEESSDRIDRLNPEIARNPFGTNSIVAGPGYERPAWSRRRPDVSTGALDTIELASTVFGDDRTAFLYTPSAQLGDGAPLLLAHDGSEYFEYAELGVVLDNLIADGVIAPLAVALTNPGDRFAEYTGDEIHARHLVEDLLPAAMQRTNPGRTIVMGASLGAVASLHAAWMHPGVFDAAILQSGSFAVGLGGRFRRGSVFKPVIRFLGRFHAEPRPLPEQIYLSIGRFEGMLTENLQLADQLRERGADVEVDVTPDGHDWGAWRNRMRAALGHVL